MNIATVKQRLEPLFENRRTWDNIRGTALDAVPKAAVLVLLVEKDDDVYVLLTRRSAFVRSEPGTVAFPGGKFDDGDENEVATALREAWEEISLPADAVNVLGTMTPIMARNGKFLVTPVIAVLRNIDTELKFSEEVDAIFYLPLRRFLDTNGHRHTSFTLPSSKELYVHFFTDIINEEKFTTWGFTAYICIFVAVVAFNTSPLYEFQPNVKYAGPESLKSTLESWLQSHMKSKL